MADEEEKHSPTAEEIEAVRIKIIELYRTLGDVCVAMISASMKLSNLSTQIEQNTLLTLRTLNEVANDFDKITASIKGGLGKKGGDINGL